MADRIDMLSAIRGGWWIAPIVLVASLGSVAYLTADDDAPVYEASATLAVVPDPSIENDGRVVQTLNILERRTIVSTLSRIPASGVIRRRAANGLDATLDDLRSYRVDTSILPSTYLVRVTVRGPDPELAASFADAIVNRSRAAGGRYYRVFSFRVVDRPVVPQEPLEGRERRTYAVAGVLGLVLGVGAAFGVGVLRAR